MKLIIVGIVVFPVLLLGSATSIEAQQNQNHGPLTNSAIIKLARAGFKQSTIITLIEVRPAAFDLTPDRMIELKRSGVGEKIIVAMIARQEGLAMPDDRWSDDGFSDDGLDSKGNKLPSGTGPDNESTDIFGSGSGTKGRSRSRGARGSVVDDTATTGSATVRIIRPPSEGQAPSRLEKTPTLTNDSIRELIAAGFSEGTIIRRIEQSPVEFDLSPAQLNELRKQGVSEKILGAMRIASGEESTNSIPPGSDARPRP